MSYFIRSYWLLLNNSFAEICTPGKGYDCAVNATCVDRHCDCDLPMKGNGFLQCVHQGSYPPTYVHSFWVSRCYSFSLCS